jgi:hypothetical protein
MAGLNRALAAAMLVPITSGAAQAEDMEQIVVTGSFIRGTPQDAALPVDLLSPRGPRSTTAVPRSLEMVQEPEHRQRQPRRTNQFDNSGWPGQRGRRDHGHQPPRPRPGAHARAHQRPPARRLADHRGVDISAVPVRRHRPSSRCSRTARPRSTAPMPSPASPTSSPASDYRGRSRSARAVPGPRRLGRRVPVPRRHRRHGPHRERLRRGRGAWSTSAARKLTLPRRGTRAVQPIQDNPQGAGPPSATRGPCSPPTERPSRTERSSVRSPIRAAGTWAA